MTGKLVSKIGKLVTEWLVTTVIEVQQRRGNNYHEFKHSGKRIRFGYQDPKSFRKFFGALDEDTVVAENLPLSRLMVDDKVDTVVDIGAHHGLYTVLLGLLNSTADLYAFEPNADNRRILEYNLQLNDLEATVRPEVVTDRTGEVTFYERTDGASESHSTVVSEEKVQEGTTKPAVSISDFHTDLEGDGIFLKIDAEGEEKNIVPDIVKNFTDRYVAGLIELHPDKMDTTGKWVQTRFTNAGYSCKFVCDSVEDEGYGRPIFAFQNG